MFYIDLRLLFSRFSEGQLDGQTYCSDRQRQARPAEELCVVVWASTLSAEPSTLRRKVILGACVQDLIL